MDSPLDLLFDTAEVEPGCAFEGLKHVFVAYQQRPSFKDVEMDESGRVKRKPGESAGPLGAGDRSMRETGRTAFCRHLEGIRIPDISLEIAVGDEGPVSMCPLRPLFTGKRVILLSLLGAFDWNATHEVIPRIEELGDAFLNAGVQAIYAITVNDCFTVRAWGRIMKTRYVQFLPDVDARVASHMGTVVDCADRGMQARSLSYACIVDNGIVTKAFLPQYGFESGVAPAISAYSGSSGEGHARDGESAFLRADSILNFLNPYAHVTMPQLFITILQVQHGCPDARRIGELFDALHWKHEIVTATGGPSGEGLLPRAALMAIAGSSEGPFLFVNGRLIGGLKEAEEFVGAMGFGIANTQSVPPTLASIVGAGGHITPGPASPPRTPAPAAGATRPPTVEPLAIAEP